MKEIAESESFQGALELLCNAVIEAEIPLEEWVKFTLFIQIDNDKRIQVVCPGLETQDTKRH